LSNSAKRFRIKQIGEKVCDCINQETTHLYLNIDNIKQNIIPLYVTNININDLTIFATNNEEIHIDDKEVIHGITESIRKASYRSIKDILKYIIPFYIEEDILNISNPLIMLRISGNGHNVGGQVKHVMITCLVLNDFNNLQKPE
ncbi:18814_t:CDS:1, partial [Gigaspora margarita]